jgi:hypothetical protein
MFASGIRSATYDGTRRRGLSNVAACNAWFKTLKQNQIRVDCFGRWCQNFRVPLLVLVNALLPDTLQFLKIAKSPATIVAPADASERPLKAFTLQRLAPITKEMLPPET